jgi:YebC/PmpR family DNA-binding regulatory protein
MSGHSKWSTIKHKKGKTAARIGGGDVNSNPRLRTAVDSAKAINMPADNVDRAIKKGTGELPGVTYEETVYEGYGPSGVALLIRALTDNKNRSTSEVRHVLDKYGGSMGSAGSVAWQFKSQGLIVVSKDKAEEDAVLAAALEAGADDVQTEASAYSILTPLGAFEKVKKQLKDAGIESESAELTMVAANNVKLGEHDAPKVLKLIEMLEELEEVQQVYANFDISDEILEKIAAAE